MPSMALRAAYTAETIEILTYKYPYPGCGRRRWASCQESYRIATDWRRW